jgi:hypothetical protein
MSHKIIIEGVTEDGRTFRPSDWIERISGSLSTFGSDRRIRYSHYLQPQTLDGKKCLVVDTALRDKNPGAFTFLMDFAKGNKLRIRDGDGPLPTSPERPGSSLAA